MIRDGLRVLMDRDRVVDDGLHERVGLARDALAVDRLRTRLVAEGKAVPVKA